MYIGESKDGFIFISSILKTLLSIFRFTFSNFTPTGGEKEADDIYTISDFEFATLARSGPNFSRHNAHPQETELMADKQNLLSGVNEDEANWSVDQRRGCSRNERLHQAVVRTAIAKGLELSAS